MVFAMVSEYTSTRITVKHAMLQTMIDKVFYDAEWYICYPHFGKHGDNEHFHIFSPATDKSGHERLRKRVKDSFGTGNKYVSVKSCKNGISCAIQYGSREGTQPTIRGDVQQWIDDAPAWIPGASDKKKRKRNVTHEDSDGEWESGIRVNMYNLVDVAVRYYKRKRLSFPARSAWRSTINAMVASGKFSWHFKEKLEGFYEDAFLVGVNLSAPEDYTNRLLGFDFTDGNDINVDGNV